MPSDMTSLMKEVKVEGTKKLPLFLLLRVHGFLLLHVPDHVNRAGCKRTNCLSSIPPASITAVLNLTLKQLLEDSEIHL